DVRAPSNGSGGMSLCSGLAPAAREPGPLLDGHAIRPVVVVQFAKTRGCHVASPAVQVMVDAVALAAPAFLVVAARVRGEEHATGLERGVQLPEHPRQLRARDMEQRCVGEDAVEARWRQLESQEVLLEDLAAAVLARHPGEARRAVE